MAKTNVCHARAVTLLSEKKGFFMRSFGAGALALVTVLGVQSAGAQENANSSEAIATDEIIVTVQKREQALIDVPIAVSAYNNALLDDLGITKFDELAVFVPGLEIQEQSPNNPSFVIRGVTSDSGEANIEPRVAVFQDGVSISRSRGSYVELHDLERVEVAKGPQATLFGRGALIGAINLVQNKAKLNDFAGAGEIVTGDYGQFRLNGFANLPLVEDKLSLRLAGSFRTRDGYVKNLLGGPALGGAETEAYRVSLRWAPTNAITADLIVNAQMDQNTGTPFKSGTFAPQLTQSPPFAYGTTSPFSPQSANRVGLVENGTELGLDREVHGVTAIVSWDVSPTLSFTSTTGYRTFQSLEVFDPDGFQYPLFLFAEDAQGEQWSQELRANFELGERWTGFVGASYFQEVGSQRVPLEFNERFVLGLFAGAITAPNPQPGNLSFDVPTNLAPILVGLGVPAAQAPFVAQLLKTNHLEQFINFGETDAIDLYGDLTFKATDKLELTGGLRWTRDDKTTRLRTQLMNGGSVLGAILAGQAPGAPVALFTQPTAGTPSFSDVFDDFTWRFVGRYEVGEDLSLWASIARGRRPEVISAIAPRTPFGATTFATSPAEVADSLEVGAKGRFLDGALNLDGSVFVYEYADFQTTEFSGTRIITTNAGEARAIGFEGSAQWRLSGGVDVFANYGYNDAQLETGARNGNRFRLSPEHSFAVGGAFTHAFAGIGALTFRPTYTWQSEVFFDDDNDRASLQVRSPASLSDRAVDEKQGSYGLVNLRAEFEPEGRNWSLGAFVTNATDEEYVIDAGNTGDSFGIPTFIRGAPRMVGVEAKSKF